MGVIAADQLPADPLDALRELARTEAELDELRREQVAAARAAGATWEQVGEALGVSRQSAWEYYAARTRAELAANAAAGTDRSSARAWAEVAESEQRPPLRLISALTVKRRGPRRWPIAASGSPSRSDRWTSTPHDVDVTA